LSKLDSRSIPASQIAQQCSEVNTVRCGEVDPKPTTVEGVFRCDQVHRQFVLGDDLSGREQDSFPVRLVVLMGIDVLRTGYSDDVFELPTETIAAGEFIDHYTEPKSATLDDTVISGRDLHRCGVEIGGFVLEILHANLHDTVS